MSLSTQKNGASPVSDDGYGAASTWQRIAVREPTGKWRTLPFAPVTVAEARELVGLGDYPATRGCFMAQKRDGDTTYLMFKGPQR